MPDDPPNQIRAFVAACLGSELLDKVAAVQRRLQGRLIRAHVRWTRFEQLHLTLQFLGNVRAQDRPDLEEELRQAAHGSVPFRLHLCGLGCFPDNRRPSVIWLGIQGNLEALQTLQATVQRRCGPFASHLEERGFQPHLTIGRVKPSACPGGEIAEVVRAESTAEIGDWLVDHVVLMRSELKPGGSIYSPLANVALTGV